MKSFSTLRLTLTILACIFSIFSVSTVKAQGIYWHEGFNNNPGKLNSSSTGPGMASPAYVTYQQADSGTWALYGAYRTTGTPCAGYGAGHIRMMKYTDGTVPFVVSPIVDKGISEIHFSAVTASKRWIIMWTADTSAITTNWTKILDSVTVVGNCVDTVLKVNLPTAKRVKFKDVTNGTTGYQLDLDSVYFKSVQPLPARFAAINANLVSNLVKVNWTSDVEVNTANYAIEKSTNGVDFKEIGKIFASNSRNYSWIDPTPANGINYYRIKSLDNNGSINYSTTVKVIRQTKTGISIFPNPVLDRKMNIQLDGFEAGKYTLNVYNINGQNVLTTSINMENSSIAQTIALPNSTKAGVYQVELTNGANRVVKTITVQ